MSDFWKFRIATDLTDDDKLWSALGYIMYIRMVLPFIVLLSEEHRQRHFQRYHAIHSLAWYVVTMVWIILVVALMMIAMFSVICSPLAFVNIFLAFVPAVFEFIFAYWAYQGLYFEVPLLTATLRSFDWL